MTGGRIPHATATQCNSNRALCRINTLSVLPFPCCMVEKGDTEEGLYTAAQKNGGCIKKRFCYPCAPYGELAEWSKAHAWKVCIRKRIEGSNPSLSANYTCILLKINPFLGVYWLFSA